MGGDQSLEGVSCSIGVNTIGASVGAGGLAGERGLRTASQALKLNSDCTKANKCRTKQFSAIECTDISEKSQTARLQRHVAN